MSTIKSLVKNRLTRIVLGVLILVWWLFFLFFLVNLIPTKSVVYPNSISETTFLKLGEVESYEGVFKAGANYLNRIDVLFKNPNLESRDELDLLLLGDKGEVISLQKFSGFNLGDTTQARMDFNFISDSKGKVYKILIRPTKIIDGKLSFGTKDGEIEFIEYYRSEAGIRSARDKSLSVVAQIVKYQPVVLVLPIFFTLMLLW